MKNKEAVKQTAGIWRLLEMAGERKACLILSGALSVVIAIFMLAPYLAVYFILAELLEKGGNPGSVDGTLIGRWGLMALAGLIARFHDCRDGRLLFGGTDVKTMDPELYLKRISMVFQDVYLFQDTSGRNIRFGRETATGEAVIEAARRACCHHFIMKLPQGYDTPVGEGGCTLSEAKSNAFPLPAPS